VQEHVDGRLISFAGVCADAGCWPRRSRGMTGRGLRMRAMPVTRRRRRRRRNCAGASWRCSAISAGRASSSWSCCRTGRRPGRRSTSTRGPMVRWRWRSPPARTCRRCGAAICSVRRRSRRPPFGRFLPLDRCRRAPWAVAGAARPHDGRCPRAAVRRGVVHPTAAWRPRSGSGPSARTRTAGIQPRRYRRGRAAADGAPGAGPARRS